MYHILLCGEQVPIIRCWSWYHIWFYFAQSRLFIYHRTCRWGNSPCCAVIYKDPQFCLPVSTHIFSLYVYYTSLPTILFSSWSIILMGSWYQIKFYFAQCELFIYHRTCTWGNIPSCTVIYKDSQFCLPMSTSILLLYIYYTSLPLLYITTNHHYYTSLTTT